MNPGQGMAAAALHFQFQGDVTAIAPHGNGHINDTWRVTCHAATGPARYILQRINRSVFRDPVAVMQNIERVTAHIAAQVAGEPDSARRALTLIPAKGGRSWHIDADGDTWRAYRFIENAHTAEAATSPGRAFQAARAFGQFQQRLAGLPLPRLNETIPDFHHTPKRFAALERTIAADVCNRAALARPEIDFALARQPVADMLLNAGLPERIAHNDTKLNNVLFDDATGEAVCVIDLDTVMPGLALCDFGDMVRTTTNSAEEDEQDLSKVTMRISFFEALLRGYHQAGGSSLASAEKRHLAVAGKLLTFEQGIRFLADYLAGDAYYKVHREGHNLHRCQTQFKLVESMEQQEETMNRLVESIAG
jgi:Ser/Thr protein kinase RdoA (MazF antagonist)